MHNQSKHESLIQEINQADEHFKTCENEAVLPKLIMLEAESHSPQLQYLIGRCYREGFTVKTLASAFFNTQTRNTVF